MKKISMLLMTILVIFFVSCKQQSKHAKDMNPFLMQYNTPFNVPPFDKIKNEHYLPAIKEGIEQQKREIEDIINNEKPSDFKNTIEALDYSGYLLTEVLSVFGNMQSAHTNDDLQKIAQEASPLLSQHSDDIVLNEELFARIKSVYDNQEELGLNTEELKLLQKTYKSFVRNGALLNEGVQ